MPPLPRRTFVRGGLYTHRYSSAGAGEGFDNPSVYCHDLAALVHGIEARTPADAVAPEVADPAELLTAQEDLTRTLLARLHADLDGRGGERWARAWELAAVLEGSDEEARGLDAVLAHPYTRTWLLDALDALYEERAGAPSGAADGLQTLVAAAAVRAASTYGCRCPTGTAGSSCRPWAG